MMKNMNLPQKKWPSYDFSTSLFQKNRKYIRYADDHLKMLELSVRSKIIDWEIRETVTPLKIPSVYHVHYHLRSITGLNDEQLPIYGDHHIMELSITTRYPVEPCKAYMLTDVWHPNIKSEGKFKGRICVNVKGFGLTYSLDQVVLRVGEILQFKNYLAEFVPPYPEDEKAAKWVREFAEPNDILHKEKQIYVDDAPLIDPTLVGIPIGPNGPIIEREETPAPSPVIVIKTKEVIDENTVGKKKIVINKKK